MRKLLIIPLALALTACAGSATRKAPSLTQQPPTPPGPPPRDYLKEAGDTTWKVVTAPARLVTPQPKPKLAPAEPIDPPAAIMTLRSHGNDEITFEQPTTQPAR